VNGLHILLTGGSGQVGRCVQSLSWANNVAIDAPDSAAFNMADGAAMQAYLRGTSYDAIINCGAYTAVDKAEGEPDLAMAINGAAPGILADYAQQHDIPLLHVSTDYVFDGAKSAPYIEDDAVGPLGIYGRSKLAGEEAVTASNARAIILRTAWVLSPHGHNFLKTMLKLGAERDSLSVVADQHGNPTSAHDIALALQSLLSAMLNDKAARGIYHFVNHGDASWHDLAAYIFKSVSAKTGKAPQLKAIATSAYPTPAKRPANSRLATGKIARDFGIKPRDWQIAIDEILHILLGEKT
jgi:dTDP-4-dehydrorhamnose reductase